MKPDTVTFMSSTNALNETSVVTAETCKLSEVIEVFERFLRGAGWDFEGHLEIVLNSPAHDDNPF